MWRVGPFRLEEVVCPLSLCFGDMGRAQDLACAFLLTTGWVRSEGVRGHLESCPEVNVSWRVLVFSSLRINDPEFLPRA